MKKKLMTANLNKTEKLFIKSEVPFENAHCCSQSTVLLTHDSKKIMLCRGHTQDILTSLVDLLTKALSNKLALHESIKKDIGYLYNESQQENEKAIDEKSAVRNVWIGEQYCWSANRLGSVWFYNDTKGSIILEVCPSYPYIWMAQEEDPAYIPYKEWIKSYKPYLITFFPQDIAKEWLTQAQLILNTIERNIKKEFNLPEEEK